MGLRLNIAQIIIDGGISVDQLHGDPMGLRHQSFLDPQGIPLVDQLHGDPMGLRSSLVFQT